MIIVRAAIMFSSGEIIEGHDYGDIAIVAHNLGFYGKKIRGFVTSSGDFVLPKEAASIAVRNGQLASVIGELLPDDLWPRWVEE